MTRIVIGLALCLMLEPVVAAGTVSYGSTHGEASGYWVSRQNGFVYPDRAPTNLIFSYVYDATIPGVTQDGEITFTVDTLVVNIRAPGYFSTGVGTYPASTQSPGIVRWHDDTISFDVTGVFAPGGHPYIAIDVSFSGSSLTPGVLPQSLDGLEGIVGAFSVNADATYLFHGDSGSVYGQVVSAPAPSSFVLLIMGMVGLVFYRNREDT